MKKNIVIILTFFLVVGLLVFFWNSWKRNNVVEPGYYESKEIYVRSLNGFLKSKLNSNISDRKTILESISKDRPDVVKELKDFNFHWEFMGDEITLSICDKKRFLRYRDFYQTKQVVDEKFYTADVPCSYKTDH